MDKNIAFKTIFRASFTIFLDIVRMFLNLYALAYNLIKVV